MSFELNHRLTRIARTVLKPLLERGGKRGPVPEGSGEGGKDDPDAGAFDNAKDAIYGMISTAFAMDKDQSTE